MQELWQSILDLLARVVTPDWGELIKLIPVALLAIVVLFFLLTARRFATAGPTRRAPARLTPVTPADVHMPGPTYAPVFLAVGLAAQMWGLIVGGDALLIGLVAGGLVNRNFMRSLGPELEAIVREEAHKAGEAVFGPRATEDTVRDYKTWQSNGGEVINFSPAETKRYLAEVDAVLQPILAATPQMKEDYEALLAAAKRQRK